MAVTLRGTLAAITLGVGLAASSASASAAPSGSCISFTPQRIYGTPHFTLSYSIEGVDAVSSEDLGRAIKRSDGVVIGQAVGGNGVPDYVEEAAIGLEYAWETYAEAGFDVPDHQPVFLKAGLGAYGLYLPECGDIYLLPNLSGVTRTAAHELAHAVQYRYWDLSDFEAVPGAQHSFYKEASADAMMIQVMRPLPYVSWFDDPDALALKEAGTAAAFFWIYYGEQVASGVDPQVEAPGLNGMARFLERVKLEGLDLEGALAALPEEGGRSLDDLMGDFVVANLLEDVLDVWDPDLVPGLAPFTYHWSHLRGFYNQLLPTPLDELWTVGQTTRGGGTTQHVHVDGRVEHQWNARYFEVPAAAAQRGGLLKGVLSSTSGVGGAARLVALTYDDLGDPRLYEVPVAAGAPALMRLRQDPELRLFVVAQSLTPDMPWDFSLDLELLSR